MGFGRRRNRGREGNYNERKGKARPKLAIVGITLFAVGALMFSYRGDDRSMVLIWGIGFFLVIIGIVLSLLSLSKRNQIKIEKGFEKVIDEATKKTCNCCKCTNCDLRHNHWTHD